MIIENIPAKCPKCQAKLIFMEAGYAKVKADSGDAAPICGHVTCWRCGYYKDVDATPVVSLTEEMVAKEKQPLVNKVIQGSVVIGLVREAVRKHFMLIAQNLRQGYTWGEIAKKINELEPGLNVSSQSLNNAYNRIKYQKTNNASCKAARADKKPYTKKSKEKVTYA